MLAKILMLGNPDWKPPSIVLIQTKRALVIALIAVVAISASTIIGKPNPIQLAHAAENPPPLPPGIAQHFTPPDPCKVGQSLPVCGRLSPGIAQNFPHAPPPT